jgi:hypothetical protein
LDSNSIWRLLRIDAPGDFTWWSKITGKLADGFLENMLQQIILVLIVAIERGPIEGSAPGNISDGDCIASIEFSGYALQLAAYVGGK